MDKICVNHSNIVINDYKLGDMESLEKKLSVWDSARFRYIPSGYMYNKDTHQLFVPRGLSVGYLEKMFNTTSHINYTPDEYETISIKVNTMPRSDIQRKSISFLVGQGEFSYTQKYSQLLLNLPTGEGKTYTTAAALQFIGLRSIVITPIDRIKNQWYDTFTNMTDVDDTHICDISGSTVIKKLLNMKSPKYKIYLVNHGTITAYAKSNGWSAVHDLFRHIKVGVKIYDEAHLNFDNIIKIDLNTNTKKTIYLTATFERSDHVENVVFNTCFKNVVRYGYETRKEIRKHIRYLAVIYNSKPSIATQQYMMTNRGFNKLRYADYQLESDAFYDALDYVIKYFREQKGKIMILSSSIKLVDSITKFIDENFEESVASYHSKISDDMKVKALESDIISTTPKSAGTGVDIHGLRTVIMCEAYSSKVQADQVSGRLREFNSTDDTFYVELVDVGFPKVYSMFKRRLPVFKEKCKKILLMDISK